METNKFEKLFKKQLDEREIKPSAAAWNKILSEVDTQVPKKNKGFLWYGIAASVLMLIGYSFFNKDKAFTNTSKKIEVVNVPENGEEKPKESTVTPQNLNTEFDALVEENVKEKSREIIIKKTNSTSNKNNLFVKKTNTNDALVTNEKTKSESIAVTNQIVGNKPEIVLGDSEFNVADAEVDKLLKEAQIELKMNQILNAKNKVDALALLQEAEMELDVSIRDQLFLKIKQKFQQAKTAIADRNN